LKPENIFVTRDERVKILDFGLAKQPPGVASPTGESATITSPTPTTPGIVMGTVGYMSPEQVRGHAVDHRSDIFSFGAILYEMVAGKRAFKGDSSVETMNAILKDDPPEIDAAQMKVSPGLQRIVRHCLEKNPAERFQSARDLAFALGALSDTDTTATIRSADLPRKRIRLAWVGVGLALVAVAAWVFLLGRQTKRVDRLEFAIPLKGEVSHLALSPDGRMLAFVSPDEASGENMLNVQRLGSPTATVLPGTEGANYPFWSPDDTYVAFFADGKLKKISVTGGVPQVLATSTTARGGSWSRRGIILYSPEAGGPLWTVNADGSNAAPLSDKTYTSSEASHRWPIFLPDGVHFLFWAGNFDNASDDRVSGIYLSSLAAKDKKLVMLARSNPGYADGYLFYADNNRLTAAPFDVSEGKISGEPRIIGEDLGFQPSTYWGAFTVAENRTVVYNASAGAALSVLMWYDRAGKELSRVGEVGVLANPTLSPDGDRVALDVTDVKGSNVDIWVRDLKRGTSARFTFDPAEEVAGTWSRDGSVVAYRSSANGASIYLKKAHGLEPAKALFEPRILWHDDIVPNSWSLDDKEILSTLQPSAGGSDLVRVQVLGGKIVPFVATKASETNGQISPDGKWAAYASNESGGWEIYVTTFPAAAGKWQVSRGGGTEPRWRGDGKEIFYIGAKGMLAAVPVNTEGTFSTGTPIPLFQIHGRAPISSTDLFTYDVSKDGKRFLVNRYVKSQHVAPLTVVLNASTESQK
jgi:Tol biopolymer transport system component